MVASHLTLIVGGANVKPELYSLVEQYEDWSGSQNLVWITNRQQGKTTTLSKFTGLFPIFEPPFCPQTLRAPSVSRADSLNPLRAPLFF